jgi:cysteine desulfurase/selenocysteine lyase
MTTTTSVLDVETIRKDFPILSRLVQGDKPLVYLDNAATSQKPRQVLDAIVNYYEQHNANVHRGIHTLAEEATALYEGARDKVARFVNAPSRDEVIFTKNSSEAMNLIARVLGEAGPGYRVGPGDEIVITEMEHHSNIVPWHQLAERTGATVKWFQIDDEGRLDLSTLDSVITERTKIVSMVHVSNLLGTINPVETIVRRAREVGALVLVDASQSAPHLPLDVTELGADFVAFTGHKMLGPTGIGVLWGRLPLLQELPPFLGGGEMIEIVTMEKSTFAQPPHKFEAGTPPIAEAVGLGAAVDYLTAVGMPAIAAHEHELTSYVLDALSTVDGLTVIGPPTAAGRVAEVSFTLAGIHPHDVGQILDEQGIAVRVGHHCARPAVMRFGIPATTRASFYLYNTTAEADALVRGLAQVKKVFG